MVNTKEKNNQENIKNNQDNSNNNNEENNMFEKKIIVYLIIIAIILVYIAQFFIHDIIDRATVNISQSTTITYPEKNDNEDINNGDNNGNGDTNGNNNGDNGNGDNNIIEANAGIRILQGSTEWKELKHLDIFMQKNYIHVAQDKIAPGVEGIYAYTVENYGEATMKYNMIFSDENPYNINMLYKLRINGEYVAGNEQNWAKLEELNQSDLTIKTNTTDIYILEWRWEDSENDTQVGETEGANYKISINFDAVQI